MQYVEARPITGLAFTKKVAYAKKSKALLAK